MLWQMAKAGFASTTGWVAWRRLAAGIALLLLLAQPTWAGIICGCRERSQMARDCRRADPVTVLEAAIEETRLPADSPGEGGSGIDEHCPGDLFGALLQAACCHSDSQTEWQGVTTQLQDQPLVAGTRPSVGLEIAAGSGLSLHEFHQLYRIRPLYQSFSCWLI